MYGTCCFEATHACKPKTGAADNNFDACFAGLGSPAVLARALLSCPEGMLTTACAGVVFTANVFLCYSSQARLHRLKAGHVFELVKIDKNALHAATAVCDAHAVYWCMHHMVVHVLPAHPLHPLLGCV